MEKLTILQSVTWHIENGCPVELFTPEFVCSVCGRQCSLHGSVLRSGSMDKRNKPEQTASMDNTTSQSTEEHEGASWQREKGEHDEGLMDTLRENRELYWKRSVAFSAGFCYTDLGRKWSSNVGSRASQELHLLLDKAVRMHCFLEKMERMCTEPKGDTMKVVWCPDRRTNTQQEARDVRCFGNYR